MAYQFTSRVYKVGINACVDVSRDISDHWATKGYIPIKGTINKHPFKQTLCPIKDGLYHLYVNIPMLKGGQVREGDNPEFVIDKDEETRQIHLHPLLADKLNEHNLLPVFESMTKSRQKDIKNYINALKTIKALERNVEKVIQ